jgi:hypothetical protein
LNRLSAIERWNEFEAIRAREVSICTYKWFDPGVRPPGLAG